VSIMIDIYYYCLGGARPIDLVSCMGPFFFFFFFFIIIIIVVRNRGVEVRVRRKKILGQGGCLALLIVMKRWRR